MLRGIPKEINPTLLKALAEMGHGDRLVIGDDFYPAATMGKQGIVVDADGIGAVDMLNAILTIMPLDSQYSTYPVMLMGPEEKLKDDLQNQEIWDEFIDTVKNHEEKGGSCVTIIDRFRFYEEARKAYVTISTGEQRPYGNVILIKGVK